MTKNFTTWRDYEKEVFSPSEIAASDLRVAIIVELIKARKDKGITQKELESLSGIKQSAIARLEQGTTAVRLDTILKILAPLGKTLAVVPMNKG